MQISRVAVVGAGTMGSGIAQVISGSGLPVVLYDIDARQLDRARAHVESIYQRQLGRGKMTSEQAQAGLNLVRYTLEDQPLAEVDLVVEAVPEDMNIKKTVLVRLNQVCRQEAILATNTSALSITDLGVLAGRPEKMIGMHFFNPAHVMKLVEVIPGAGTNQDTVETVKEFVQRLAKIPVLVRECPGFLVNRLLFPYLDEAVVCFQEGAATVEQIDAAMGRNGFGWPMGPFALMDMLGIDVCHHIAAYLGSRYGERMAEPVLLEALFAAGRYGQKSDRGFYDYPGGRHAEEVDALLRQLQERGLIGQTGSTFSAERLMARLINEAFMCLEEQVASAHDVDLACVAGLGMQVRRDGDPVQMGPLEYARALGLKTVLQQLRAWEAEFGARFRPAGILEELGGR